MRPILMVLTLLACASAAAAQVPPVVSQQKTISAHQLGNHVTTSTASIDDVVSRLMSFDRDSDGRVAEAELNERMRHLVALGDADGNGALDRTEIRSLAQAPRPPVATTPFLSPGYALGHEVGLTSRAHVEGALDDLRLPAAIGDKARALAARFLDAHEEEALAELLKDMETLLTASQLLDFTAAVTAERERGRLALGQVSAPHPPGGTRVLTIFRSNLGQRIDRYKLSAEKQTAASAVLERFHAAFRPGDIEWPPLMQQMHDLLSDEQRHDLRAALDRQPIVRVTPMVLVDHVILNSR